MAEEFQEIKVGNEILRFPINMSDEEIAGIIQGDTGIQAQLAEDAVEYEDGYLQGQSKAALTVGASFVEAVAENPIWGKLFATPTNYDPANPPTINMSEMGTAYTADFRENEMKWADRTADFFGWEKRDLNLLPKDQIQATLGAGAIMMFDPLVLVSKAKNISEFLLKVPLSMAQWGGIGVTSSVAANSAGGLEEAITGENSGIASTIAGVGSALLGAKASQGTVNTLAGKADDLLKGAGFSKEASLVKSTIETQSQKFAHANVKNMLKEISKIEGRDVEEILKDFAMISHAFDDVDIPLFLAMADNPIVAGELNKLIRIKPAVRLQVEEELLKITTAIESKANQIFGVPIVGKSLEEAIPTSVIRSELWYRLDNLKTKAAATTDRINELGANYLPVETLAQRGKEIAGLIELKKAQAKAIRAIEYKTVLDTARKDKVMMPKEGVQQIWQYVNSLRLQNKFGTNTALDTKINSLLKPTVKTTRTKNAAGKTITTKTETFKPMSFDDLNSLKIEINKQLRKNPSDDTAFMLDNLKGVVDEARTTIPGTYNSALKLADENYYKYIGIPFGEVGIKEISSAKYAQQIAPVIVQNAEALGQFFNVVGDAKGIGIAKNAFLAEVYEKSIVNGQLQPKLLQSLIKKKSEVVDMIPGLREELELAIKSEGYLSNRVKSLNDVWKSQEKKIGEHFLLKAGGVEGYQPSQVVGKMIKDREYLAKINKDISRLPKDVQSYIKDTIRREFVNQIEGLGRAKNETSMQWLTNPENAYTVQKLMGKGYQNDVRAFARLSDKVSKVNPDNITPVATNPLYDVVQAKTGVDLPSIISLARRPIISMEQKIVIFASRVFTGGRGTKANNQMQDILFSDLKGLEEFYKLEKLAKKTKMSNEDLARKYTDIMVNIAPKYFMAVEGDTKRDVIQEDLEEQQNLYRQGIY